MFTDLVLARPLYADPYRRLDTLMNWLAPNNEAQWPFSSLSSGNCATNIWEDDESVYVQMEIPGVNEENLDMSLTGTELTVKIETAAPNEPVKYLRQERVCGETTRVVTLPLENPPTESEAKIENGILTIRFKKPEEITAQKISISKNNK